MSNVVVEYGLFGINDPSVTPNQISPLAIVLEIPDEFKSFGRKDGHFIAPTSHVWEWEESYDYESEFAEEWLQDDCVVEHIAPSDLIPPMWEDDKEKLIQWKRYIKFLRSETIRIARENNLTFESEEWDYLINP